MDWTKTGSTSIFWTGLDVINIPKSDEFVSLIIF
jgi:hypothetical protein